MFYKSKNLPVILEEMLERGELIITEFNGPDYDDDKKNTLRQQQQQQQCKISKSLIFCIFVASTSLAGIIVGLILTLLITFQS